MDGTMTRRLLIAFAVVAVAGFWAVAASAQTAKTTLDAAATALGATSLKSIQFSGWGSDYIFGQAYDPNSPWPRFYLPSITVTIDYTTPAWRDDRRRTQVQNPPLGGGFQPLLVERIETWVDNPVLGDMLIEAVFSDYKDFGGVKFPTHILQREGGYPVLDLTITDVKPNAAAAIEVPANIRQAKPPAPAAIEPEKLSDGVWIIPGAAKSIAVEFRDHIVVIDAPETEARSIAVIDAIKKIIPGKPIRYVVNTHTHFDHAGGLRTYAAEGASIITQSNNVAYYEQVWANPHTINPDRLVKSGRKPVFEGLVGSRTLSDGSRTLVVYHYAGNMHNAGLLMVFLPKERILIEADSFNPSNNPSEPPAAISNLAQFYDSVERLRLDVDQIIPIHGRLVTLDDARTAIETYEKTQEWKK